ncbi:MAG: DMT family transporter [Ferruginibacter sp.]|nr:DMT family transporter [Cytophagales bacterium]
MNQTVKVHLALTTVAVLYSANYSIAKSVTPAYILPFGLVGLRVMVGSGLFWLTHRLTTHRDVLSPDGLPGSNFSRGGHPQRTVSRRDYYLLFLCGLCGIAVNQLLFIKGLSLTSPINASLLVTTTPILVFLLSAVVLKERITGVKAAGLLLGAGGTVMLLAGKDFSFNSRTLAGDLILLLSTVFFGTYLILVKPLSAKYSALTITRWAFVFGLIPVVPFSMGEIGQVDWAAMPLLTWLALAFIILGATVLAYLLNNWTLQYVTPSVVGIYIYLQPLLASLIAVGLGQDSLTPDKVLLGGMILLGVYLVGRK